MQRFLIKLLFFTIIVLFFFFFLKYDLVVTIFVPLKVTEREQKWLKLHKITYTNYICLLRFNGLQNLETVRENFNYGEKQQFGTTLKKI